jgi:hypothetical protein
MPLLPCMANFLEINNPAVTGELRNAVSLFAHQITVNFYKSMYLAQQPERITPISLTMNCAFAESGLLRTQQLSGHVRRLGSSMDRILLTARLILVRCRKFLVNPSQWIFWRAIN